MTLLHSEIYRQVDRQRYSGFLQPDAKNVVRAFFVFPVTRDFFCEACIDLCCFAVTSYSSRRALRFVLVGSHTRKLAFVASDAVVNTSSCDGAAAAPFPGESVGTDGAAEHEAGEAAVDLSHPASLGVLPCEDVSEVDAIGKRDSKSTN